MRGPLAAFHRTHHRLTRKRAEHNARGNLRSEFRDRPHYIDHIDDLVLALPVIAQRLLTGQHKHRYCSQIGVRHGGRKVGGPGPERGHGNRGLAGQTTIGGSHETCCLLMAAENKFNAAILAQRLHEMQVFVARNAEYIFHALSGERLNELICSVHDHSPP